MVSQRQRLARKRFKEANPDLLPKRASTPPKDPSNNSNMKKKKKKKKKKSFKTKKKKVEEKLQKERPTFRKHPLRIPGMKPGDSCFICKAPDHIAKLCPDKAQWEKNKICLHCRRRGHSLKNCPDKGDNNEKKYCYNCGEVGHSLSNCSQPLQEGGTKFANCFICNERGHLSKNCPKNTHGIYPKGGSCKICGGVTHLAKDCPNKGNKNMIADSGLAGIRTLSGCGEIRRGRVTIFRSGDDLDDDFMVDDVTAGKKGAMKAESISLGAEVGKEIPVKSKKLHVPKFVNFVG